MWAGSTNRPSSSWTEPSAGITTEKPIGASSSAMATRTVFRALIGRWRPFGDDTSSDLLTQARDRGRRGRGRGRGWRASSWPCLRECQRPARLAVALPWGSPRSTCRVRWSGWAWALDWRPPLWTPPQRRANRPSRRTPHVQKRQSRFVRPLFSLTHQSIQSGRGTRPYDTAATGLTARC